MDDALGHAGGAAGIEDVQRVIEGHGDEFRLAAGLVEVAPQADAGRRLIVLDLRVGPTLRVPREAKTPAQKEENYHRGN